MSTRRAGRVSYAELTEFLGAAASDVPGISVQAAGQSSRGRDIYRVAVGHGPVPVIMWSQMHGNEPTHTLVLVELLKLLASDHPVAERMMQQCTLTMLPMLNPDGAEAWTRQNAQGIDINRDARRLSSPEARVLHQVVNDGEYDFALNLHNQSPTRTVDGTNLAALSMLVPPIDQQLTQSETVVRAKKLASLVRYAAEPFCPGMISRYDAGFMPRCFGEYVQAVGISTLLIEAGGCPQRDREWLTHLHFFALVSALSAIASGSVDEQDVRGYESLTKSSVLDLFDVLVTGVQLDDGHHKMDSIDLAITRQLTEYGMTMEGILSELGDLDGRCGREVIDGTGLSALPGRIAYDQRLTPTCEKTDALLVSAAKAGITTLIGSVDLGDARQRDALLAFEQQTPLPIDVGWVGLLHGGELVEQLQFAANYLLLGIVNDVPEYGPLSSVFNVPFLSTRQLLDHGVESPDTSRMWMRSSLELGGQLGLPNSGRIVVGNPANLVFTEPSNLQTPTLVLVRGILVVRNGVLLDERPGVVVRPTRGLAT